MADPTKKPHLLVLASTYPRWMHDHEPGFVHELAKRLVNEFEVTVVCPHASGALSRERLECVDVVRVKYAPERLESLINDGGMVANLRRAPWKVILLPGYVLAMMYAVRRLLANGKVDVVHAHWIVPQGLLFLLASIGRRKPLMVTSHGADLFALKGAFFRSLRALVCRHASIVTVVSPAMKERLVEEGVEAKKIEVASMGVDLRERFVPDPGVIRSDHEILFVGRLVQKKGLNVLLDALPEIVMAFPSAILTIAGFGPEAATLKAQATTLGLSKHVDFLGAIKQADLPGLYRRAAVFVAPFIEAASGDQEGLGLVTLEAAGCGCPVVISDLPATRELFEERVTPGHSPELAVRVVAMLSVSRHSRDLIAASQRERLIDKYDWFPVTAGYSGMLKTLAAHGHAKN